MFDLLTRTAMGLLVCGGSGGYDCRPFPCGAIYRVLQQEHNLEKEEVGKPPDSLMSSLSSVRRKEEHFDTPLFGGTLSLHTRSKEPH